METYIHSYILKIRNLLCLCAFCGQQPFNHLTILLWMIVCFSLVASILYIEIYYNNVIHNNNENEHENEYVYMPFLRIHNSISLTLFIEPHLLNILYKYYYMTPNSFLSPFARSLSPHAYIYIYRHRNNNRKEIERIQKNGVVPVAMILSRALAQM